MPRLLHVGCGLARKAQTIPAFASNDWHEVTLDIDERVRPDIVDSLPDLTQVGTETFDAIFSSHNLEHLYPHEIPTALAAFKRVLAPDGFAIVTCPDLQSIGDVIAAGDLDAPIYESRSGPVTALDMLYGFRPAIAAGNAYMAHHCGFTLATMRSAFRKAGFAGSMGLRRPNRHDLWIIGVKKRMSEAELTAFGKTYLPQP